MASKVTCNRISKQKETKSTCLTGGFSSVEMMQTLCSVTKMKEGRAPSGGDFADDDDDEFSRAIANGIQQQEAEDAEGDVNMDGEGGAVQPLNPNVEIHQQSQAEQQSETAVELNGVTEKSQQQLINGLPHAEEAP
jgi:transcriptional activator SPT8